MTEPIEQWEIEFKKFTDGFDLYGNEWQDMGCDKVFKAGFEAAKRSQKPVELPDPNQFDDLGYYFEKLEDYLTRAGYKYTVKGE